MGTPVRTRKPFTDRIIDDIRRSVGIGSLLHFLGGYCNSPQGHRMIGGAQAVRIKAPLIVGRFTILGGLFSTFDCTSACLRQKEDPWNSIIAGAATMGLLAVRQGFRLAIGLSVFGGVTCALFQGGLTVSKYMVGKQETEVFVEDQLPEASEETNSSWFGGKKMEEEKKGVKSEILESFDAPMPATFEFK